MTDSRQGGQRPPHIISDEGHVAHYCSPTRIVDGRPSGTAFELREARNEKALSVDWLEVLDPGDIATAIGCLRPILANEMGVSRDGRLAVLNVGEAREAARKRGNDAVRIVHWPKTDRQSYARIENYGDSRAQRLRVAEAFRDLVQQCHMYDAA